MIVQDPRDPSSLLKLQQIGDTRRYHRVHLDQASVRVLILKTFKKGMNYFVLFSPTSRPVQTKLLHLTGDLGSW